MASEQLWFDTALYAWVPGIFYSIYVLAYGSLAWILAAHDMLKLVILPAHWIGFFIAWGLVAFGLVALVTGQPAPVWLGFCVPGGLGLIAFPATFLPLRAAYARAREGRQRKDSGHG